MHWYRYPIVTRIHSANNISINQHQYTIATLTKWCLSNFVLFLISIIIDVSQYYVIDAHSYKLIIESQNWDANGMTVNLIIIMVMIRMNLMIYQLKHRLNKPNYRCKYRFANQIINVINVSSCSTCCSFTMWFSKQDFIIK